MIAGIKEVILSYVCQKALKHLSNKVNSLDLTLNLLELKLIKILLVIIFILQAFTTVLMAQGKVTLEYQGDSTIGGQRNGENFQHLIGHVEFIQKTTTIHCDSAYFFNKRRVLEAFGHVHIFDSEDSINITSDKMIYDGTTRISELRDNVVYVDDSIHLYTDFLDYDMINKSAKYFNGGKIIDGVNTLTSQSGVYDTEGKLMTFNDDVKLVNPNYTLMTDELIYNIITKKARTTSRTVILTSDQKELIAQDGGEFDTANKLYSFSVSEIDTDKYKLKADQIITDQVTKYYNAEGQVYVFGKKDKVIITGDNAKYWENEGRAKVYGHAIMKKILNQDTLFLSADTLVSIDSDSAAQKRLLAYPNVKIFKTDIQGKSDSLAYYVADSTIYFYDDPVLWSEDSQISADSINAEMKNGNIDRLNTSVNSFIISEDSISNYNQVKGRKLTAFFDGNKINKVNVNGNGESLYYILDEKDNHLIGMNKIFCSSMKILFKENQVNNIIFITKPDGSLIPPQELKEEDKQLEGFSWRIDDKPSKAAILGLEPTPVKKQLEEIPPDIGKPLDEEALKKLEIIKNSKKSLPHHPHLEN